MDQHATLTGFGPPQVPLFKATQYVGNVLELGDTIAELIYELLPGTAFTVWSGRTVGDTFEISELSLAQRWSDDYTPGDPHDDPDSSLFWTTLFDFVQARTGDENSTSEALAFVQLELLRVVVAAGDRPTYPVLFEFHLAVVAGLLASSDLSLGDIVQISVFLGRFRTMFAAVVAYSFPVLDFTEALGEDTDGWSLDVDAVVQVHLPATAAQFLTWTLTGTGAEIFLHFDRIVVDDATGLALTNPHEDNDGQTRFPFGGSVGDLTLTDVVVNISVRGELARADDLPIAPYHRYRQAFFTQRSTTPCETESLVGFALSVGSVDLDLNASALATLFSLLTIGSDAVGMVQDAIEAGVEGLHDFGEVGSGIANALAPLLPDAAALHTHDFFKPFTNEHVTFTYDGLGIEGEGQGIHILNHAPEPDDPDPDGPTKDPDPPTDFDPPILDQGNPFPVGGSTHLFPVDVLVAADRPLLNAGKPLPEAGGTDSPLGNLVLAADRRPEYLASLDAMADIPPVEEAAARLWLDGVPPAAIAWIRASDVDRKGRHVGGRPVSVATLASLARLAATGAHRSGSFLFATSPRWPATTATLTSLLAPFETLARTATDTTVPDGEVDTSGQDGEPWQLGLDYALESPLARRKGSSLDPSWVGLSVNVIAVTKALAVLIASDTLGQSGTVPKGDAELTFRVDLEASQPTVSVDLSGEDDSRPVVSISGLTIHYDEDQEEPATYRVACEVPMEAIKPDPGCLPDDAIRAVVFNRSCIAEITGGEITDAAYLDELLYRYFVHLGFISTDATVTTHTLTDGEPIGRTAQSGPVISRATPGGPFDDDGLLAPTEGMLLSDTVQAILAATYTVPVVFDPYYAQSPVIRSYDAKEGWLNVYESYS